tara:strand:+ start:686 stop:1621 length:936 start_codon:yes stop_codon:yes gene_type:complete
MIKKFIRDHKVHKSIVSASIFDYMFLYKPIYLAGPVAMILSGMYLAAFSSNNIPIGVSSINLNTALFVKGVLMIISCIFIKNQIDESSGNFNIQFNFIGCSPIGNTIDVNAANIIHNVTLGLGFLLVAITNWITMLPMAIVYFVWTSSFFESIDLLFRICIHAFVALLLLLSGYLYSSLSLLLFLSLSIPYILSFTSIIVLIIYYYEKKINIISLGLIIAAFFISYINNDPLATTAISVSIPFHLFLIIRGFERDLVRAVRYPIFLLNFFIFTIYPLSIVPMVIVFYISKYYYWHKFNIHFPALAINDDYN